MIIIQKDFLVFNRYAYSLDSELARAPLRDDYPHPRFLSTQVG